MPIKWSALRLNEAMDMVEEFVNQAVEPLEQAKVATSEARNIASLPQYLDRRLIRLICDIERIDNVRSTIESVHKSIPDGATEAERERLKNGSQQSLI